MSALLALLALVTCALRPLNIDVLSLLSKIKKYDPSVANADRRVANVAFVTHQCSACCPKQGRLNVVLCGTYL